MDARGRLVEVTALHSISTRLLLDMFRSMDILMGAFSATRSMPQQAAHGAHFSFSWEDLLAQAKGIICIG